MGQRGTNSKPEQQRINIRNSRNKLLELLTDNFRNGAHLVMLTYGEGVPAPSAQMAELQLLEWLRTARSLQEQKLRYIRSTDQEQAGNGSAVHRIVVALPQARAAALAALWWYGPSTVEPVQESNLAALADVFMRPALEEGRVRVPCGRTWKTSVGLIRPGKKGEQTV